jgi:hypothetical protein
MSAQREAQQGKSSESLVGREMGNGVSQQSNKEPEGREKKNRRNEGFTEMEPWRRRERELKY